MRASASSATGFLPVLVRLYSCNLSGSYCSLDLLLNPLFIFFREDYRLRAAAVFAAYLRCYCHVSFQVASCQCQGVVKVPKLLYCVVCSLCVVYAHVIKAYSKLFPIYRRNAFWYDFCIDCCNTCSHRLPSCRQDAQQLYLVEDHYYECRSSKE